MSFSQTNASDRLLAVCNKTSGDSNLPSGILSSAAAAVYAACEEMRIINPALFSIPRHFLLAAPATITFTLAADLFTFSALTGTIPRAGCTVLMDGESYHNRVETVSGSAGTFSRASTGASGARTATVWEDCWYAANTGTSAFLDRIIGNVTANGRPIDVLTDPSELTALARRTDFRADFPITPLPVGFLPAYSFSLWNTLGAWSSGPFYNNELTEPGYREPYEDAQLLACWIENRFTALTSTMQALIRFAPMPKTQTVVNLFTVGMPSASNTDIGLPDGLQETIFIPIALNHWMLYPYFKPDTNQAQAIREAYKLAVTRLRGYRVAAGAQPYRTGG